MAGSPKHRRNDCQSTRASPHPHSSTRATRHFPLARAGPAGPLVASLSILDNRHAGKASRTPACHVKQYSSVSKRPLGPLSAASGAGGCPRQEARWIVRMGQGARAWSSRRGTENRQDVEIAGRPSGWELSSLAGWPAGHLTGWVVGWLADWLAG